MSDENDFFKYEFSISFLNSDANPIDIDSSLSIFFKHSWILFFSLIVSFEKRKIKNFPVDFSIHTFQF